MKTNTPGSNRIHTHEGATARRIDPVAQLRRSVLATMLFEDQFYEDGVHIATRICNEVKEVDPETVANLAAEARNRHNLRHAPLLLMAALATRKGTGAIVRRAIPDVVRRPDELAEILSIHAKLNGRRPDQLKGSIPNGLKDGLAKAFTQFDRYQLAKYSRRHAGREVPITLRDVMFLTHPKPQSKQQEQDFADLAAGTLEAPDTWETRRLRGEDAKSTFEGLLRDDKLGYMALLRNLRKMDEVGVDRKLVRRAIRERRGAHRMLPFRYFTAAKHAPGFTADLDAAFQEQMLAEAPLGGSTVVVVDVSGSMGAPISARSEVKRYEAAAALAALIPGEDVRVFVFANTVGSVQRYQGLAQVEAIRNVIGKHGYATNMADAIREARRHDPDRIIVISDEQSHQSIPGPGRAKGYVINTASYKNGVGYGEWLHVDGFSEATVKYIRALEAEG